MVGENYAVARRGNQMFASLKFQKKESDVGLSTALRNSSDLFKSLVSDRAISSADSAMATGSDIV